MKRCYFLALFLFLTALHAGSGGDGGEGGGSFFGFGGKGGKGGNGLETGGTGGKGGRGFLKNGKDGDPGKCPASNLEHIQPPTADQEQNLSSKDECTDKEVEIQSDEGEGFLNINEVSENGSME